MKLSELVESSVAVSATRSRKQKTDLLAACLRRMHPDEIELGVAYLAGALPGGRTGLGPAAVRSVRGVEAAEESTLTLPACKST